MKILRNTLGASVGLFGLAALLAMPAAADFVILDDLIVDGSACIGFDCVNGESFGFDTIRIKENNLRIKADDTSVAASFPRNDWQLTFNDSANGGAEKFSVDDITNSRTPFTIEASAPSHSLYVDDGGRIGLGTATPVVEVHIKDGDTPTLRLEQDGSSGFTPQTWDVAGNETNFFIRDVTNGSTLPLRIRPSAPTSALDIANDGDVGLGTSSPQQRVHILDNDNPGVRMEQGDASNRIWDFRQDGAGNFIITEDGTGGAEVLIRDSDSGTPGQVEIAGDLVVTGQCTEVDGACAPDYVFEADYELPSLSELSAYITENKHLPNVPSAAEIEASGINMRRFNFAMLEKIEELVLYTLGQQETIDALTARLDALEKQPE